MLSQQKISIIIPVINEAGILRNTLSSINVTSDEELIVVDGGSTDETMSIAQEFTDKVLVSKTGRASVMNFGAEKAEGDILLFLHADCILPDQGFYMIRETLKNQKTAAGGFYLSIDEHGPGFRLIEYMANVRARLTSLIYGDQGMFVKRDIFKKVGGFSDMPLMEDIDISRKLGRLGRIVFLNPPIKASARRWLVEGAVFTTLRDWTIAFSYSFLRISPEKLIKYYKEVR
ncbi:MAG: TIGR04283 family arsenosugar biosynthesis glycosyltransferase [Nitrospiraceae bacterium]|nr:MAG: TIGR04283 family arsenosugar biosynthesis glycosyltransferase [Nitrospiraceae bacterium]